MSAVATLVGTFRLGRDAEVRTAPDHEPACSLLLAYNWGRRDPVTDKRLTQWVDAHMWGRRVTQLSPGLVRGALVWALIEDIHVERYAPNTDPDHLRNKLTGRIGRIEILSPRADAHDCTLPKA